MTTEVIEGEAVETGVIVVEPVGLARAVGPDGMIALASQMATALKDIVERQRLFAVIQGKKYPQVEAWMTIARMDNVVAREGQVIANEDGSFEAHTDLIRLSDGAVIGHGSALCGTPDDKPWNSRALPARRSMAVTRATSRAFRQQYSWIMALAGYEPTPAEEMPRDDPDPRRVDEHGVIHPAAVQSPNTPPTEPWLDIAGLRLDGTVSFGKAPYDGNRRETPDGAAFGFRLELADGKLVPQVLVTGGLADDIFDASSDKTLAGQLVSVEGDIWRVPWDKDHKPMPAFQRLLLTRIETPDWNLPAGPSPITEFEAESDLLTELDALVYPDRLPAPEPA